MRLAVLVLVVAIPAIAFAKPKVAVAPIAGDRDGKVTEIVADAAREHAKLASSDKVEKAVGDDELDTKSAKKLRSRLEVDAVLYGKVERTGGKKRLDLVVQGRGKKRTTKLSITFKSNKALREELAKKLAKPIEATDTDDKPDRADADRQRGDRDDDRRSDRDNRDGADRGDGGADRADGDDDDDGERRRRKKKRRHDDDEDGGVESPRHQLSQAALWLDAGLGFEHRTLSYDKVGSMAPPPVGTAAPAGRIEGEVYPLAFTSQKGPLANIGLSFDFSRVVLLSINQPAVMLSAPITSGSHSLGARYRILLGNHSIALGLTYWRRYFMADRSKLMNPGQLDMPDVDYSALAPGAVGRVAITPNIAAFGGFQIPLMFDAGPIQDGTSYGSSTIIAADLRAGAQIALRSLGPHYALQITGEFDQMIFRFDASPGTLAQMRGVNTATDRVYGLSATLGIMY